MSSTTDYANAFGFHSVVAAVVFGVVYIPLFLWFVRQSIKNMTYVYISLSIFCLMRVVAFILRAILIKSTTLQDNLNIFIADQIMFGVGFFALLYSAFTLVLDREVVSGAPPTHYLPLRIMGDKRLFRIILIVGVVLGVKGTIDATSSNANTASSGSTLRRASTILFLVLTILQTIQTFLVFNEERPIAAHRAFGDRHGKYIMCLVSLFLLVREVFMIATIGDLARQDKEALWFPLVALPEVLCVVCYAISGLVPPRSELKKQIEMNEAMEAQYPQN
ncbi:hypothetical protein DFH07DRAFT_1058674 [Mycena maculata]|uniref:DUF7702 domain-containing protein n=1 Tax=Mycena maculata TaxID=230809 RepID=A0AAD7JJQ7_9AGAR|nr:hypothetical protein DFH07DRAFT_1058674 [Mycena maculata]